MYRFPVSAFLIAMCFASQSVTASQDAVWDDEHTLMVGGFEFDVDPKKPAFTAEQLSSYISNRSDVFHYPRQRQALADLRALALAHDSDAQAKLADYYMDGYIVQKNINYALAWYLVAAHDGSAYAQYLLSVMFTEGEYLPHDVNRSVTYRRLGDSNPNSILGERQLGIRRLQALTQFHDTDSGISWLKRAAIAGDRVAQETLGDVYYDDVYTKANQIEAIRWYSMAWNQKSPYAAFNLAMIYQESDVVEKDLPKAFQWMSQSATAGLPAAQYHLGEMYLHGIGVEKDSVLAYVWFSLASRNLKKAFALNEDTLKEINGLLNSFSTEEKQKATMLINE